MNGNVIIKYFDVQGHSIEPDIKVYKSLKLAVVNANKRKRTLGAYNQIHGIVALLKKCQLIGKALVGIGKIRGIVGLNYAYFHSHTSFL